MTPPPRTRRRRSPSGGYVPEETRRALIDSALALFGANGYAATAVQEITEAAGVTKGAFYHHFESKEVLLRLIHDEFVDYQLGAMRKVIEEHDNPVDQMSELLRAFMLSVHRYQSNVTIFLQERRYLTGERFAAVKSKRDEFDEMFLQVIERGIKQQVFRADLDARVAGLGILGMCAWTHQWFRPGGRLSAEEIAAIFVGMLLDGMLPPSGDRVRLDASRAHG